MKLNKKQIIIIVICSVLALALIVTGVVFGIRHKNKNIETETTSNIETSTTETTEEDSSVVSDTTVTVETTLEETKEETSNKKEETEKPSKQNNNKPEKPTQPTKPQDKPTPKPTNTTTTNPSEIKTVISDEIARRINNEFFALVNAERQRLGVAKLARNTHLDSCAQKRSTELLKNFGHVRPDGSPYHSIIDNNSYPYVKIGENVCMTTHLGNGEFAIDEVVFRGTDEQIHMAAQAIFNTFKNSPPHYSNMMDGDYKDTGIGISYKVNNEYGYVEFYVAHLFGKLQ